MNTQCLCPLLLLFSLIAAGADSPLPDTIDKLRASVVAVGTLRPQQPSATTGPAAKFMGTGFVVGNGRQVITNYHVLPKELNHKGQEVLVIFSGRGEDAVARPVRVLATDQEHDLALLSFSGKPLPSLTLAEPNQVREGQSIAITGFPIGMVLGLYPVTHRGIVSAISPIVIPAHSAASLTAAQVRRMRSPFNVYQLDATAYPGNSGSPLYDQHTGHVVGVINSVLVKTTKEAVLQHPSGISYAIPIVYVQQLLSAH